MRSLLCAFALLFTLPLVGCDAGEPAPEASLANASTPYLDGPSSIRPGDECEYTLVGAAVTSQGWGGPSMFSVTSEHFNSATIKAVGSSGGGNIFAHSSYGYPIKKYVTVSSSAPLCDPAPKTSAQIQGPSSMRPGAVCSFTLAGAGQTWGSTAAFDLESQINGAANFEAVGAVGSIGQISVVPPGGGIAKKQVLISNRAPICNVVF